MSCGHYSSMCDIDFKVISAIWYIRVLHAIIVVNIKKPPSENEEGVRRKTDINFDGPWTSTLRSYLYSKTFVVIYTLHYRQPLCKIWTPPAKHEREVGITSPGQILTVCDILLQGHISDPIVRCNLLTISNHCAKYEHTPYNMGHNARKHVFGGLRTTQAQTSLRIRAVWSAPLLFAFWKVTYVHWLQKKFQFSS